MLPYDRLIGTEMSAGVILILLQGAGNGTEVVLDQWDEPIQKLLKLPAPRRQSEQTERLWRLPLEGMRQAAKRPATAGDSHQCDFRLFHAAAVEGASGVELLRVSQITLMSDSDSLSLIL